MSRERKTAESLAGLRRLSQDPSPEAARELLTDWRDRDNTYDETSSSWRATARDRKST